VDFALEHHLSTYLCNIHYSVPLTGHIHLVPGQSLFLHEHTVADKSGRQATASNVEWHLENRRFEPMGLLFINSASAQLKHIACHARASFAVNTTLKKNHGFQDRRGRPARVLLAGGLHQAVFPAFGARYCIQPDRMEHRGA
jgi:hypothetical protein